MVGSNSEQIKLWPIRMPPLNNARHERFVQGLLEGKSASQAYEDAGFRPDRGNAARLSASPQVQARLAELQSEVAKDTKLTVEGLLAELEQARAKPTDLKQLSASVRAIEAKAKISGLLVQRMEIGGPGDFNGYNQDDPADIVRWLTDHTIEDCARTHPELASYINFSDDDRATILSLFQQICSIIRQREKDAYDARYNDLMRSYRPTARRLTNGNGAVN
jgi:predicted Fe-S protein YdhL (DUF1289 family)